MAAIIDETRKQRKMTVEELAERSGVKYGTLRNILRAQVDVKIPDLVAIAAALSATILPGAGDRPVPVLAADLVDAAVERVGSIPTPVSEVPANTVDLQTRRLQREAEQMSAAEIESRAIAAAADDAERHTAESPDS